MSAAGAAGLSAVCDDRPMADGDDLLGGLPKTRPTRRGGKQADNRPKAAPGTPAKEAGAPARPKARTAPKAAAKASPAARGTARPAPARQRPKQAPGSDATPPAAEGGGGLSGLAQQGLGAAAGVVRGVLRRLPRP